MCRRAYWMGNARVVQRPDVRWTRTCRTFEAPCVGVHQAVHLAGRPPPRPPDGAAVRIPAVGQSSWPRSEWPSARADRRVEWPSAGRRLSRTCVQTCKHKLIGATANMLRGPFWSLFWSFNWIFYSIISSISSKIIQCCQQWHVLFKILSISIKKFLIQRI
jgi:hypothetical protein